MELLSPVRAVVGLGLMVVPGIVWAKVLLPDLRGLARALSAVGLSTALMVLVVFLGSAVARIAVSATHVTWWAILLSVSGWAVSGWQERARKPALKRS